MVPRKRAYNRLVADFGVLAAAPAPHTCRDRVWCLVFGVWCLVFGGLGFGVWVLGFGVEGFGFGCRV
jgi:hypothetical protein